MKESMHTPRGRTTWEYRVVTQNDRLFRGRFDVARLAEVLEELGAEGWRLAQAETVTHHAVISKDREQMLLIFERERGRA